MQAIEHGTHDRPGDPLTRLSPTARSCDGCTSGVVASPTLSPRSPRQYCDRCLAIGYPARQPEAASQAPPRIAADDESARERARQDRDMLGEQRGGAR